MRLKPITPADAPALLALMCLLQDDDPWSVPFDAARVLQTIEMLLRNPQLGLAWFIEYEDEEIGYIILSFDFSLEYGGRNAWVDEFFILPEFRNRGLGEHTLAMFEEEAREAGAVAIHLEVNEGNRAIALYRRRGFEEHHRFLMTKFL